MFRGDRSVAAKSTSWTWPAFKPGNASTLLEELGLKEHKPDGFNLFSVDFNKRPGSFFSGMRSRLIFGAAPAPTYNQENLN